ncbi:chitin synthase (Chitin-UDP-GlcNac-transferase) [Achlya hypogyna]|uniref:chitin synthase n=1 Tax=Achlya hypogyna TaxID=1202772 RepID=A0A1V9YUV3_ACHHY|nr:chitin synthase (Chitin-UDP-GlcNac-transferase) [Achlya hypogyna]
MSGVAQSSESLLARVANAFQTRGKTATAQEGFRLIEQGVAAESQRHYKEAIDRFMSAARVLESAAQGEVDDHVKRLLGAKALDAFSWAEALVSWLERNEGPCPVRRSLGVSVVTTPAAVSSVALDQSERTCLHYTPVTTIVPGDFTRDGYCLSVTRRHRHPRMLIVVTMYNEDASEIEATLHKVANNVAYLRRHGLPGYEGDDAWQNILVCVVSDGRSKANPSTLAKLREFGVFDEDTWVICSKGLQTTMHLFEKTVLLPAPEPTAHAPWKHSEAPPPLQVVFALKEANAGKLNSHLWFFHAFCAHVDPVYTVLLDVGTLPTKSALYKLLGAMEVNEQVGGVCGEIAVSQPLPNLTSLIIATQHYEYKISNVLDKATESCFGFISVLPGAFSAYRYKAIQGPPLDAYFKSLTTSMLELGPFAGNMYLAEDRILCFELLARKRSNWTMMYVKDAIARTDVPTTLVDLIAQRRRWLNGSFFAMLYTIFNWGRIFSESRHSMLRGLALMIQYCFMVVQVVFNWFLVGNFYLTVYYVIFYTLERNTLGVVDTTELYQEYGGVSKGIFNVVYGLVFAVQIVLGMGNKSPKHVARTYRSISWYYMLLVVVTTSASVLTLVHNGDAALKWQQIGLGIAIFGVYFVGAACHCELHHILLSFVQYSLMLPVMINTLTIYSFCNLQDLSWGTKGIDASHEGHGAADTKGEYKDVIALQKAAEARAKQEAHTAGTEAS